MTIVLIIAVFAAQLAVLALCALYSRHVDQQERENAVR